MSGEDRTIPERPVGEFWFGYNEYVPLPEVDDEDDGTEQRLRGMTW